MMNSTKSRLCKHSVLIILWCMVANGMAFIMQPLPNRILKVPVFTNWGEIWSGIVVYAFLCFSVFLGFYYSFSDAERNMFKIKQALLKTVIPLIVIRLGLDILSSLLSWFLLFSEFLLPYAMTGTLLIETAASIMVFVVICRRVLLKRSKPMRWQRIFISLVSVLLLAIAIVYAIATQVGLEKLTHITDKYSTINVIYEADILDFSFQLIHLVYNIILWVVLFCAFGVFHHVKPHNSKSHHSIFIKIMSLVFGAMISLVGIVLVIGIKLGIAPNGSLSTVHYPSSTTTNFSDPSFSANYQTLELGRKVGYMGEEIVYDRTAITILYGNDVLLKFNREIAQWKKGHIPLGQLTPLSVNGTYRYETEVIAYLDNGNPKAILTKNINDLESEDKILTDCLKEVIQEGHFDFFEHSYKYLLKYDRDFILPYIDHFASGELTDAEQSCNENINISYIMQFAQQIKLEAVQ